MWNYFDHFSAKVSTKRCWRRVKSSTILYNGKASTEQKGRRKTWVPVQGFIYTFQTSIHQHFLYRPPPRGGGAYCWPIGIHGCAFQKFLKFRKFWKFNMCACACVCMRVGWYTGTRSIKFLNVSKLLSRRGKSAERWKTGGVHGAFEKL